MLNDYYLEEVESAKAWEAAGYKRSVVKMPTYVGFFDRLTPEQQRAVLAYDGDDTIGESDISTDS